MVLQELFDLSDQEAINQFAFNIQWQYALNISEEDDGSTYLCEKTLWNMRKIFLDQGLARFVFDEVTNRLKDSFGVDCDQQRLDSVHIQSMKQEKSKLVLKDKFPKSRKRRRIDIAWALILKFALLARYKKNVLLS